MDKLFLTVLNMSLTGAFVIAAVILARLPLKKAPKIISYCLWAVVGFRLVFPFSLESMFSLIPWGSQPISETELLNESVSFGSAASAALHAIGDAANGGLGTVTVYLGSTADGYPITTEAYHSQVWLLFLPYVWSVGAAAMLLYGIISYALLKRRMGTAIRIEGNLYETDNIGSPFILGIIKPRIYLPLSLASGEHEYILLHERTHIRRRDHIIKFAAYFILCLHWFNPLAWAAFLLMGVDMEMSCDERVLKEMGGDTKHDYSRSLLSLATQRRVIGGSPLAFGEGGVKERVKNVLNFRKPSRVIIVAAVALVAVLSIGFAANRASGNLPFKNMNADEIDSISLFCIPPDVTVVINDRATIEKIANILQTVVTYEKDDSGREYNGQLVQYTLTMFSGETIEIGAYNPFVFIDGQCYKTKYEPCEELNRLGNQLRGDKKSPYQEALAIINEHYPEATEIISTGSDTINYTNPPAPVEAFTFEIVVDSERITCAVSKERGIFFTYSDNTWWAFTGLAEWSGATQHMTLDDVRAIAQKIGPDLTMGDLRDFIGTDIGSGIFVMQYYIENSDYMLIVGSVDMNTVAYANLIHATDGGPNASIDIRYYDVDKFINDETKELVRPLPLPTDLEVAISQAILDENKNGYNPGDYSAEAHTTLTVVEEGNTATAYLMVLYQNYGYRGGSFSELSGSHMPVAITFDKSADGGYSMTEYWIPRDGSYYAPSIKEKFPANIYEDALDTQKYIYAHKMSCYEQAIQYGAVDVDNQIALLLKTICSSPTQASDPGAYIEAHSIEYRELVYYGRYTLDYCFMLFEQGGQTGLEGHIMAAVCSDIMPILGETVTGGRFYTGQDWYDAQSIR